MVKNVNIGRYLDPHDWRVLTDFLVAIGFVRTNPDKSIMGFETASFSSPLASFSFTSWNNELPKGLAKDVREAAFLLALEAPDAEHVYQTAKRMKLRISTQDSAVAWSADQPFSIRLPGSIVLGVRPQVSAESDLSGKLDASHKRFAIVVARFNSFITERLLLSACDGLLRMGANKKDIAVVRVPGAFEIPSAARTLAQTKKYDAIICIGCLLRGDTAHYDVIVNEVTRGIGQSAQETGVPHAFGVLTCDSLEQAIDRAGLKMGNKGFEAALAAVEMASLKRVVSRQSSVVRKNVAGRSSLAVGKGRASKSRTKRKSQSTRKS